MGRQFGHTAKWILIVVLLILSSCTSQIVPNLSSVEEVKAVPVSAPASTVFAGTFTTEQIRAMWVTCHNGFIAANPYLPQEFVAVHCDCYSDYVRQNYIDNAELAAISKTEGDMLRQNLITECNLKIQQGQQNLEPTEQT